MKPILRAPGIFVLLFITVLGVTGCDSVRESGDDEVEPPGPDNLTTFEIDTDGSGNGSGQFILAPGAYKFALTAQSGGQVRFDFVSNEDGTTFVSPSSDLITLGTEFSNSANSVNIPSRSFDSPAVGGRTYTVDLSTLGSRGRGENVTVTVSSRSDGDLESGTLALNVFFVGDIAQLENSRTSIRAALDQMRSIYRAQADIGLSVSEFDISGSNNLPDPTIGASLYASASAKGASPAVNIFVGGDVNIDFAGGTILGVSASIPGPPIPTSRSAVAVSLTGGAGIDGEFSPTELRILGETIAHESGHFMGLFHPVEIEGFSGLVVDEDPLPDTNSCSTFTQCEADPSLAGNLMFPFPVGDDIPQDQLTGQQAGVLNRYAAVD